VEEQLLLYAEFLRSKWLILPSMKKLNALSSMMAIKGPFTKLFSKHSPIWNYCEMKIFEKGKKLDDTGTVSNRLIILLHGKVSFYVKDDKKEKRVSSTTSGAILLEGVPCNEIMKVDKKSRFIIFTKDNLEKLKMDKPQLSLLLHNDVLYDVFIARNDMERSLDTGANSHWDTYFTNMKKLEGKQVQYQNKLILQIALGAEKKMHNQNSSKSFSINGTSGQNLSLEERARQLLKERNEEFINHQKKFHSPMAYVRMDPASIHVDIKTMTVEDVITWLTEQKLDKAAKYCQKEEINGRTLNELDEDDFLEMGILPGEMKAFKIKFKTLTNIGFYRKSKQAMKENLIKGELIRKKQIDIKNREADHTIRYTLSRSQMMAYQDHFKAHATQNKDGTTILPTASIRHTLLDLGYYKTNTEINSLFEEEKIDRSPGEGIDLDKFLHLMVEVTMKDLEKDEVDKYANVFATYNKNNKSYLDKDDLDKLILDTVGNTGERSIEHELIEEWECTEKGRLNFEEFLSMIAYSLQYYDLEYQTILAYYMFANENNEIGYQDIINIIQRETGATVTEEEAKEMIWEVDIDNKGKIRENNFVEMITTMYEPGWIVHYKWRDKTVHRFMHDLIEENEFDQMDEVDVLQEKKSIVPLELAA